MTVKLLLPAFNVEVFTVKPAPLTLTLTSVLKPVVVTFTVLVLCEPIYTVPCATLTGDVVMPVF